MILKMCQAIQMTLQNTFAPFLLHIHTYICTYVYIYIFGSIYTFKYCQEHKYIINLPCSYGENVPASMFIYGSILIEVTSRWQDLRSVPKEDAMTPLPTPLITPPVTNMYFISFTFRFNLCYDSIIIRSDHVAYVFIALI